MVKKYVRWQCVFAFLLLAVNSAFAQRLMERRVYYLDCSYSMVPAKLWDKVRDNLKNAIDKVEDETTELIVIPFACDSKHHSCLDAFKAIATSAGKDELHAKIDGLPTPSKNTMTYHNDPIKDFMSQRVAAGKVTYLFLMTDGEDEDKTREFDKIIRDQWTGKYGSKDVYGFYVMLNPEARDPKREKIIKEAEHFWSVETAAIDINLVRLDNQGVFNIRNEKYMDIPVSGKLAGLGFTCSFDPSSPYKVTKTEKEEGRLRVYIDSPTPVSQLPSSLKFVMNVQMTGTDKYTFLLTDKITVNCKNEKEYSLKVTVK